MTGSKRHPLCSDILFLFSLISQFGCSGAPADPPVVVPSPSPVSATAFNQSLTVDLTASPIINSATISISNKGSDPVAMPAVFVQGGSGLSRRSILSFIKSAGPLTDEQFALATWGFVTDHNQHYCVAGAPGDLDGVALDPMRLLHAYGFTCCQQSTAILIWLWRGLGYYARGARMDFHTVPEIYYGHGWHMYDADHQVYYLAEDNKTVASVAEIIADPDLVRRTEDADGNDPSGYSAQSMADQYALSTPIYFYDTPPAETTWSLSSSQTFTLRSENSTTSIFHGPPSISIDPLASDAVTSGQFDWELDFARPDWKSLTNASLLVEPLISGTDTVLTNSSVRPGYAIYHLSSPFPVLSLSVSGIVYRQDDTSAVNVYVMREGSDWSNPFPMNAKVGSPMQTTADLTNAAGGQYSYFVMLQLSGSVANAAQIAGVHITSQVQVAKILFPILVPGAINHLTYQDWSPASDSHNVEISVDVR